MSVKDLGTPITSKSLSLWLITLILLQAYSKLYIPTLEIIYETPEFNNPGCFWIWFLQNWLAAFSNKLWKTQTICFSHIGSKNSSGRSFKKKQWDFFFTFSIETYPNCWIESNSQSSAEAFRINKPIVDALSAWHLLFYFISLKQNEMTFVVKARYANGQLFWDPTNTTYIPWYVRNIILDE